MAIQAFESLRWYNLEPQYVQVPKLDFRELFKSAVVLVLVIAVLQYFGGIMVETPGQVDITGLATIAVVFLIFSAVIAIVVTSRTSRYSVS